MAVSPEQAEEAKIREALRRCSPETVAAALGYRKNKDANLANTVVVGVLCRFVEPDQRPKLQGEPEHLRLLEDLGLDSLTMVEVVMLLEEVLQVHIKNEELQDLRTLGDVKAYVHALSSGLPPPKRPLRMDVAAIAASMPHQPPFLFLRDAELRTSEASGTYAIKGDEFFLSGHFKDRPVFPASLLLEALGQLAVLALLKGPAGFGVGGASVDPASIYFTSADGVRCTRICKPGDVLDFIVRPKRVKHPLAVFEGHVSVNGEKAAFVEEVGLTFDFLRPLDEAGKPSGEVSPDAPVAPAAP